MMVDTWDNDPHRSICLSNMIPFSSQNVKNRLFPTEKSEAKEKIILRIDSEDYECFSIVYLDSFANKRSREIWVQCTTEINGHMRNVH